MKKIFRIIPIIALLLCFSFLLSPVSSNAYKSPYKFKKHSIKVQGKKIKISWTANKKCPNVDIDIEKYNKKKDSYETIWRKGSKYLYPLHHYKQNVKSGKYTSKKLSKGKYYVRLLITDKNDNWETYKEKYLTIK